MRLFLKFVAVVFIAVFSCAAFIGAETYLSRKRAEKLFAQLRNFRVGQTMFDEVRRQTSGYGNSVRSEEPCTPEKCTILFEFNNKWLRRLHLSPPAALWGRIDVLNGQMNSSVLHLSQGPYLIVIADTSCRYCLEDQRPTYVARVGGNRFSTLTPRSSSIDRQSATALNLEVLSRIGAVTDADQLLRQ